MLPSLLRGNAFLLGAGYVFILLYLTLWITFQNRHQLDHLEVLARLGFRYKDQRLEYYQWSFVLLLRRFL